MTSPATGARPLRIAHLSDLPVLSPLGVEWRRAVCDERITGHGNLHSCAAPVAIPGAAEAA